jgi:hypothetical protein
MVQLLQPMPTFMLRAALRLGMRERVLRLLEPKHRRYRLTSPPASGGAHGVPSCAAFPQQRAPCSNPSP